MIKIYTESKKQDEKTKIKMNITVILMMKKKIYRPHII